MPIVKTTRTVTVYTCSDGKEFTNDETNSALHEATLQLKKLFDTHTKYTGAEVKDTIIEKWDILKAIMEGRA